MLHQAKTREEGVREKCVEESYSLKTFIINNKADYFYIYIVIRTAVIPKWLMAVFCP